MHLFVQACILGLLTGGVYALMASGLTLAFGIMRVINVAQGALIVLGAFLSYTLFTRFQIDPFVGIFVIAPAMFVLGVGLQLAFLRVLRQDERDTAGHQRVHAAHQEPEDAGLDEEVHLAEV